MTDKEKYRLVDKINHRLKAAIDKFDLNKDEADIIKQKVTDILPNSDMITKSGYISTAQKNLDKIDEHIFKSLEANLPNTITQFKESAIESLDKAGFLNPTLEDIQYEVKSYISVNDTFDEIVNEWYDTIRSVDILTTVENPIFNELDSWLYSKGQKSYGELQWFVNEVNKLKSKGVI